MIRPDDVIPKVVFDATVMVKDDFGPAITTRTKWKRGLRDSGETSPILVLSTLVLTICNCSFLLTLTNKLARER